MPFRDFQKMMAILLFILEYSEEFYSQFRSVGKLDVSKRFRRGNASHLKIFPHLYAYLYDMYPPDGGRYFDYAVKGINANSLLLEHNFFSSQHTGFFLIFTLSLPLGWKLSNRFSTILHPERFKNNLSVNS